MNINCIQVFIKLLFRYLELSDSLRLRHEKRLMNWDGL